MTANYISGVVPDIDLYQQIDTNLKSHAVQLDRGPLRIGFQELAFSDISVARLTTDRGVAATSIFGWTHFVLCGQPKAGPAVWCGVDVQPHTLTIMRSGREHHYKLPAGWDDVEVSVADHLLAERGLLPRQLFRQTLSPEKSHLRIPEPSAVRLSHWLRQLLSDVKRLEAVRRNPACAQNLREDVLGELSRAIRLGWEPRQATRAVRPRRRFRLVREALDVINDRRGEYLTVEMLAQSVATNTRGLQRAFRDVFGISPYQYLLRARLSFARAELRSLGDRWTIARIATNNGFCSASEFARHYKALFGETPSETMRRQKSSISLAAG